MIEVELEDLYWMLQQKMKKNNFHWSSKNQSSTLLASTDENISSEQSGSFIKSQKERLTLKIKKLEFVLTETKREQQALLLRQAHLIETFNAKKSMLGSMNEEVLCSKGHSNIKKKVSHQRTVSSTQSQTVDTLYPNQQTQQNGKYCTEGNNPCKKSPPHTYNLRRNIQVNLNFTHSSSSFQRSYLKKCYTKENLEGLYRSRNGNKYESIEEIWNQQRSNPIPRYRKDTVKTLNQ